MEDSNSCPQSGHTKTAFLWLPAGASLGEQAFLLLHMAAAFGYLVAKSLMPETIFLPAQTGQPVLPFITERTTLKILLSNSCPQSGQTNVNFLLLPAATLLGEKVFLSLHMAATLGHLVATSLMPGITFLELVVLVLMLVFIAVFIADSLSPRVFEACKIKIAAIIFTITASYMSIRRAAECHAGIG